MMRFARRRCTLAGKLKITALTASYVHPNSIKSAVGHLEETTNHANFRE